MALAQPPLATFPYTPGTVQLLAEPLMNMRALHWQDTFWQQLFTLQLTY